MKNPKKLRSGQAFKILENYQKLQVSGPGEVATHPNKYKGKQSEKSTTLPKFIREK